MMFCSRDMRWLTSTLLLIGIASVALAQNPFRHGPANRPDDESKVENELPPALLLTERGRALAEELKQLRRTEASLGGKHPLLPEVRARIAGVKEQIEAWSPRVQQFSPDRSKPLPDVLPEMNDQDLRQLILRMAAKIAQLERRIETLEERAEVH
ncbi:MAG: hypothetical protein AAGG48_13845 [Planctomycetota bacterium]